jgi:hypothetical protein
MPATGTDLVSAAKATAIAVSSGARAATAAARRALPRLPRVPRELRGAPLGIAANIAMGAAALAIVASGLTAGAAAIAPAEPATTAVGQTVAKVVAVDDMQQLTVPVDAAAPAPVVRDQFTVTAPPPPPPAPAPPVFHSMMTMAGVTPTGNKAIAADKVAARGWDSNEFSCLEKLWQRESSWSASAHNKSSGAHGIAQALPGSKMASVAADWETNPATQIEWGIGYIANRYGTPCSAWAHSESSNWY